jgi:hypothetical protein
MMKENITNRPDAEDIREEKFEEKQAEPVRAKTSKPEEIDTTPLPTGMRETVETVEVSTFRPKG